jgi:hypothetical protein
MPMTVHSKSELSKPRRYLLELMQRINFGRIEGLVVRGGEPAFDSRARIIREIKLGGEHSPYHAMERADFELKAQVIELFEHITALGNGTIGCLDVKHGLPFRLVIEEADTHLLD